MEQECFGLPQGSAIMGITVGLIILLWGFVWLAQQIGVISPTMEVWPIAAIIFGILLVIGAIYRLSHRPST
jgi:hypothetical protein